MHNSLEVNEYLVKAKMLYLKSSDLEILGLTRFLGYFLFFVSRLAPRRPRVRAIDMYMYMYVCALTYIHIVCIYTYAYTYIPRFNSSGSHTTPRWATPSCAPSIHMFSYVYKNHSMIAPHPRSLLPRILDTTYDFLYVFGFRNSWAISRISYLGSLLAVGGCVPFIGRVVLPNSAPLHLTY